MAGFTNAERRRIEERLPLSKRLIDIAEAMVLGETMKQTAVRLGITVSTVRNHRVRLYDKLRVHSPAQVVHVIDRVLYSD